MRLVSCSAVRTCRWLDAEGGSHTDPLGTKIYGKVVHTLRYMLLSAKKKCAQVLLTREECAPVFVLKRQGAADGNAEGTPHTYFLGTKSYGNRVHTLRYMLLSAKKKCAQVLLTREECALSFVFYTGWTL